MFLNIVFLLSVTNIMYWIRFSNKFGAPSKSCVCRTANIVPLPSNLYLDEYRSLHRAGQTSASDRTFDYFKITQVVSTSETMDITLEEIANSVEGYKREQ